MLKYILYRILGNDLPPRHSETQTIDNLKFILEYEEEFPNCEKRFVLNRIVDTSKQSIICDLLMKAGYKFSIIPFRLEEYKELISNIERVQYLTNVNRARNYCIEQGIEEAEYVMPFDGGNMFRSDGWASFDGNVRFNSEDAYFLIGQWRVENYDNMLNDKQPTLSEEYRFGDTKLIGLREPTIVFGQKHDRRFNEELRYGQADKVELLFKLGVPGIWDRWEPRIRSEALKNKSNFYAKCKMVGWVARLPSGNKEADEDNSIRGRLRFEGLQRLVEFVNSLK